MHHLESKKYLLTLILYFFAFSSFAEIYRWTDENGRVHFSGQPPRAEKRMVEAIEIRGSLSEEKRFNNLENEIGEIKLKSVAHGENQQYIPEDGLDNFKIVVVNHGMFGGDEAAVDSAKGTKRYAEFVKQGVPRVEKQLIQEAWPRNQLTGDQRFVNEIEKRIGVRVEKRGRGRPKKGEK